MIKYFLVSNLIIASNLNAQTSCELVRKLAFKLGCEYGSRVSDSDVSKDFVVRKVFKSGCKIGLELEKAKRVQNKKCEEWLSKQKKNLGKKYNTGTCAESCTTCETGLDECVTTGEAHYSKE